MKRICSGFFSPLLILFVLKTGPAARLHGLKKLREGRRPNPQWFRQGSEKIHIDGEEKPSVWGTGTEDFFLCAWRLAEAPEIDTIFAGKECADEVSKGLGSAIAQEGHVWTSRRQTLCQPHIEPCAKKAIARLLYSRVRARNRFVRTTE